MKAAAKFDRANPCTKVHLWNAFRAPNSYPAKPVVEVKAIIGDNAPKYMLREGYLTMVTRHGVDWYSLTSAGIDWLEAGIKRYIELHPEAEDDITFPIPGTVSKRTIRRVTAAPPVAGTRVIRRRPG